ncbi:MAG: phosphoethanolamine--lipid A transferase [Betaproteobacteria bacterium]|nr:phosphoethanolamine--lipid A transferase [Betaproteobacteria bacterium]
MSLKSKSMAIGLFRGLFRGFRAVKSHWLILILAFYFAFVLNLGFWRFVAERIDGAYGILFAVSMPLLVMVLFVWLFSILVIPVLGKPIIIGLLLVSSAANCAIWNLGIVIDSEMIRNVFETDLREASDFITLTSICWVALTGIVPAILLILCKIEYQSRKKELLIRTVFVLVGAVMLGGFYATAGKEYASFLRNHNKARKNLNTFNYIHSLMRYYQRVSLAKREFIWLDREAMSDAPDEAKNLLILVVGEAARAMNFSLNGYSRETNPLLAGQNIVNFRDAASCGTATAVSVPCMFSHKRRKEFDVDEARHTQNLLDILSVAGHDIFWFENDGGCKGVCARVPTENVVKSGDTIHCERNYCRDEVMLPRLEEKINNQDKNMVIVLHMMGSHGPSYYQRYPQAFRKFTPTCDTSSIQKCSREEIVNTYDNTILYTDYILSSVIDIAKKFDDREVSILYASDHGQSLGENGAYLHGLPYAIAPREQTHIPVLLWLSDAAQKRIDYACMKKKADNAPFLHDHIFHSVIGLMQIRTSLFDPSLDIFQGCYIQ